MLSRESYILTEVLGRNSPEVRALVAAAASPGMEAAVHEMLRSLVRQRGWNPDDPPRFALPQDISPSDFVVGTAMSGDVVGPEVGPSEGDLPSHLGVFGMTATGKTTLVKLLLHAFTGKDAVTQQSGRTFLVLDAHGEYRNMLPLFAAEELVWLSADEIGLNPFEVPSGEDGRPVMAPDKWINTLREIFRLFWLNEPSLNLLCEVLREEYERHGVFNGSGDWPSLSDVIDALHGLSPPRGSDRAKAKDKLLDRLESLRALLPGLDVQRSRDFRQLMAKSVILDLVDVKDVALPALFALLVTLFREVFRSEGERGITRMLVMEEAHLVLGGQADRRTSDLKESTPSGVLRDLRKTGTTGVVVSQLIGDVARGVLGNLGSIVCLRQSHQHCVRQAAAALNLKAWQEEEIARLPNRRAIARFSRYPDPVCLVVRDARALFPEDSRPPSREEARERSRPILEAVPYIKKCEAPAAVQVGAADAEGPGAPGREKPKPAGEPKAEGGLPPAEARVYARIAAQPWELIEDRMDALGLDREAEGQARARLEARGLIAFAGKAGAKHRLFELTARGHEIVDRAKGLAVFVQGKGSVVHEAIVRYTERSLGRHSTAFRFQRVGVSSTLGGVQPDLLLLLPSGGRVPIQACHKNTVAAEAEALVRLHRLALLEPGDADRVDFVLAVCANRRHMAALGRALMKRNGGRLPGRVVLSDFDAIVDPGFDWAEALELPL